MTRHMSSEPRLPGARPMHRVLQVLVLLAATGAATAAPPVTVLRAARLYDGKSDAVVTPGVVVVSRGADRRSRDAGRRTRPGRRSSTSATPRSLPGLMDAHTHLSFESSLDWKQDELDGLKKPIPEQAIDATEYARRTLLAGFTTVRDLGSSDLIDVGLRNAINAGQGARAADAGDGQRHRRARWPLRPDGRLSPGPAQGAGTGAGRGQRPRPDPRRGALRRQARRRRHQDLRHRRRSLRGRQGGLAAAHPGRARRPGRRGPCARTEDRGARPRCRGREAGHPCRHRFDRARLVPRRRGLRADAQEGHVLRPHAAALHHGAAAPGAGAGAHHREGGERGRARRRRR